MLGRLTDLVVRRRRAVLVTTVLLALIGGMSSMTLFGKLSAGGWDNPAAESGQAAEVLEDVIGQRQPNLVLLVSAPAGVEEPAAVAAGTELTERLAAETGVADVVSYWTSGQAPQLRNADGDKALILATIPGDATAASDRLTELLPHYEGERDGLDVRVGGYVMFEHELSEQSERDVVFAEMIVFPIMLVALVVVFGSLVAAALPLAVALVTTLLGMGLMWVLASVTDLSILAVNAVTLLGLGLAIDYSLLMVSRYREELRFGSPTGDAIRATMRSAGRTVLFSAVTVAIALSALTWFPLGALRSIGYAGMATAALAGAAALTVLPALFALLGPRIEKGRVRRRVTAGDQEAGNGSWHRLAMFVMRRPVPVATSVTAVLLLLGAPFLGIRLGQVDERTMPESSQARQVATTIRTEFDTGEQNALQVVVPESTGERDAVASYAAQLSELERVARVDTATGSYAGGAQVAAPGPEHERFVAAEEALYISVVPAPGEPEEGRELVRDIRGTPAPFDTLVGGPAAVSEDGIASLTERLPFSLAALTLAMVVLLFLLTGSVLLPFLALVLSTLSLTATFGALVWIFQDGNLAGLLGDFTVTGSIDATVPVLLFAIGFGLAMDYQVFMLSRISEEHERRGGDTTAAVAMGLERMGGIVTAAAALIAIVFLAFLVSDITLMKAFGVGLPLAVLLDATLVRGALLPATMRLGGRATWWAPWPLRRLYARFGLREAEGEVRPVPEPVISPGAWRE